MIELSNSNAQVLEVGQSATFDIEILHTGCAECHRRNTGSIGLTQRNTVYEASFNCNIGGIAAGDAQIALTLNGAPLNETTAKIVTATAGDLENVSAQTFIPSCCCGNNTILLTNTGTTAINLGEYPRISVKKLA